MTFTKAGAIIFTRNPKPLILLIKSSNPMFGGTAWQLPKGQVDPGETPEQAGFREAKEEAGLLEADVLNKMVLGNFKLRGQGKGNFSKFLAIETHTAKVTGTYHFETGETRWFTVEDAAKLIRHDQKPILAKLLAKVS